jgi:methyl-accepting chemotaxis protein
VALLASSFQAMEEALAELAEKARAVAGGNLGVDIAAEGDIADSFRTMVENLRGTVRQMAEAAAQVAGASAQIQFASEEQEVAAQQQSASVEQVRRTIDSLLEAAAHISESAQGVLSNAERTRATTGLIAGKVAELGRHTSRITEILDIIREIADRSDLLALNASIEATRAGEAGRSFALVAAEMRRLAERVTASVQDVKTLVDDIRSFGASTVMATEEGRKLAESTTESARQITMVTQQQRSGTQQVTESMKDIAGILAQSVTASQQTRALAETLNTQATLLADVVGRFRLSGNGYGSGNGNGNGTVVPGNVIEDRDRKVG